MFVSAVSCNYRRFLRTFAISINYLGRSQPQINDIKIYRLRVNMNVARLAWTCSAVRHATYVTINSAIFSTGAKRHVCRPSLETTQHDDACNSPISGGILCFFRRILWYIWETCMMILRVVQLLCIFTPLLLLYPLLWFRRPINLKNWWYKLLIFDLELAGPIFVKLGQWVSTRRDQFPKEVCSCLSKLQRKTTPHSWFFTKKSLERAFGSHWRNIFVKFENDFEPVGSGCCAQVYKAWVNPEALTGLSDGCSDHSEDSFFVEGIEMFGVGKLVGRLFPESNQAGNLTSDKNNSGILTEKDLIPVALKVRHPRIQTLLRRDLNIMKAMASAVTWIFPCLQWLSLVDCVKDFEQLMKAQVNFCVEACNLDKFTENFRRMESVIFPKPLWVLTRPYLLVETYEEGKSMQHYLSSKSTKRFNVALAELGINTILKMVFNDNFAHGDLHPGNVLVREKDDNILQKKLRKWFPISVISKLISPPVSIVILDCGITVSLDERGKKCLKDVFAAVAKGDGKKVGELFLTHSRHQCYDPEGFKLRMNALVQSALNNTVTLKEVEVSTLVGSLFSTLIDHQVKLDGHFSSIILAIMVVEGLGRSLDPTIDLIEKATPFLFTPL